MAIPDVWPEGSKLLVEADEVEEVSSGGIILTRNTVESDQLNASKGTVLRLGPGVALESEKPFVEGTRICFAKYGGFRLKDLGYEKDYRIINDTDVHAVLGGKE